MNSTTTDEALQAKASDKEFYAVFAAAKKARASLASRPHRALTPLTMTPGLRVQALLIPIILCSLLWLAKPFLFELWRQCILFWSTTLNVPFTLSSRLNKAGQFGLQFPGDLDGGQLPSQTIMAVTTILFAAAFAATFAMKRATFPLRYPIRIICVIQFATLAYFWWAPNPFPYNIARHSEELMTIGFVVMLVTPVMLAMGYYILKLSLWRKLLNTALILLFFMVMVPHQVMMQAIFMQHFSIVFMPIMYICLGAVFDTLVFVALYSWIASNVPKDATV
jgi:hypothetical protein